MYALIGDMVNVMGQVCVIITYDDDMLLYLVWVPDTRTYLMVHQNYVREVDRWIQQQYEEVELDAEGNLANSVAVGNGLRSGGNSGTFSQRNGIRNATARAI